MADESTTLLNELVVGFLSTFVAELALVLKETLQQRFAFAHPTFAKVGAKKATHVFHFAVHNLAVSIDHIGREHHKRGEKIVRSEIVVLAEQLGVNIVGSCEV